MLRTISPMICGEPQSQVVPPRLVKSTIAVKVGRKERSARVVHRVAPHLRRRVERDRDHAQRDDPHRQVDVEDPAPAEVVDEEPAEQRADDRREPEHGAEVALVLAALARRDDVADDGQRDHDQPAGAEPLHGAKADQLPHALREAAERRADEEDHDRGLEDDLAPVEIAELAVERPGNRRGQQVRRDDPGQMVEPAELADDGRQRRRDDRLVERGQQQDEQERAEDQPHPLGRLGHSLGSGVRLVLELSGRGVAIEEPADPALDDRHHQGEVVLEHARVAEASGRDRVVARVAW